MAFQGRQKKKRIGRGGNRGKTAGRGHKGQRARAGRRMRPAFRDVLQRIPKLRGHGKNRSRTVRARKPPVTHVSCQALFQTFAVSSLITPQELVAKGLVRLHKGRVPHIKMLCGRGAEEAKALQVRGCMFSAAAEKVLTDAGGQVL